MSRGGRRTVCAAILVVVDAIWVTPHLWVSQLVFPAVIAQDVSLAGNAVALLQVNGMSPFVLSPSTSLEQASLRQQQG